MFLGYVSPYFDGSAYLKKLMRVIEHLPILWYCVTIYRLSKVCKSCQLQIRMPDSLGEACRLNMQQAREKA
jgi:hypothetical protein